MVFLLAMHSGAFFPFVVISMRTSGRHLSSIHDVERAVKKLQEGCGIKVCLCSHNSLVVQISNCKMSYMTCRPSLNISNINESNRYDISIYVLLVI